MDFENGDLGENPHPFGQLPCLVDGNEVCFESGAILIYLVTKYGKTSELASIISWIVWANASLDPICFMETPDGKVYDTGLRSYNKRIDQLDQMLDTPHFFGDSFTMADV